MMELAMLGETMELARQDQLLQCQLAKVDTIYLQLPHVKAKLDSLTVLRKEGQARDKDRQHKLGLLKDAANKAQELLEEKKVQLGRTTTELEAMKAALKKALQANQELLARKAELQNQLAHKTELESRLESELRELETKAETDNSALQARLQKNAELKEVVAAKELQLKQHQAAFSQERATLESAVNEHSEQINQVDTEIVRFTTIANSHTEEALTEETLLLLYEAVEAAEQKLRLAEIRTWQEVVAVNQQIGDRDGTANALRGELAQKKAVEKQLDLKLQSSSFELAAQKKMLDGEEAVNKAIGEKIIAARQTLKEQQQAKAKLSKEANTSGVLSGGGDGGNEGLEQLQLQQKQKEIELAEMEKELQQRVASKEAEEMQMTETVQATQAATQELQELLELTNEGTQKLGAVFMSSAEENESEDDLSVQELEAMQTEATKNLAEHRALTESCQEKQQQQLANGRESAQAEHEKRQHELAALKTAVADNETAQLAAPNLNAGKGGARVAGKGKGKGGMGGGAGKGGERDAGRGKGREKGKGKGRGKGKGKGRGKGKGKGRGKGKGKGGAATTRTPTELEAPPRPKKRQKNRRPRKSRDKE
jgi:hypothetical protein